MPKDTENQTFSSSGNAQEAAPTPQRMPDFRAKPVESPANPVVKLLKALHEKKGRAETGLFLAEGARLIAEAADAGWLPETAAFTPDAAERPKTRELLGLLASKGVRLLQTSPKAMGQIAKRDNPQTIIGAFRQKMTPLEALKLSDGETIVALHMVRDPGNLGTIVRTADAVGAKAVILVDECCDPFSVEAVRATMGSLFAVPLARTNATGLLAWRDAQKASLVGAALGAASRFQEDVFGRRTILLMGNEQSGLPDALKEACDAVVEIRHEGTRGFVESRGFDGRDAV